MNQAQVRAVLPFMIAFSEGKTIQIKNHSGSHQGWGDIHDPLFAGYAGDYRIKPEPERMFLVGDGTRTCGKFGTLLQAQKELSSNPNSEYKIYECVEVL